MNELQSSDFDNTKFTLYSLDPDKKVPDSSSFHGYKVLGQLPIEDSAQRSSLLTAMIAGLKNSPANPARCFVLRHGLQKVKSEYFLTVDWGKRKLITICVFDKQGNQICAPIFLKFDPLLKTTRYT